MDHLRESLHTLVVEQQELYQKAALSALSIGRLHQRLIIMERYFLAMTRKGVAPEVGVVRAGGEGGEAEEVENGAAEEREAGGVVKDLPAESASKGTKNKTALGEKQSSVIDTISKYVKKCMSWPLKL